MLSWNIRLCCYGRQHETQDAGPRDLSAVRCRDGVASSELAVPLLPSKARMLSGSVTRRVLGTASAGVASNTETLGYTRLTESGGDIDGSARPAGRSRHAGGPLPPRNENESGRRRAARARSIGLASGRSSRKRRIGPAWTAVAVTQPVRWIWTMFAVRRPIRCLKPSIEHRTWTVFMLRSRSAMLCVPTAIGSVPNRGFVGRRHLVPESPLSKGESTSLS
jgi:hypothetical protein